MGDKTVLILENDEKFVKALKLYFRGSPYDAESVTTIAELATQASSARPDVIIAAVEEGDAGAGNFVSTLVQAPTTRGVPIIVMSTAKDEASVFPNGVAEFGAAAYIKKPFIKRAILSLLDDVLAGGAGGASAPAKKKNVDLGAVFTEIDQAVDDFFEEESSGGDDEFTIALEDDESSEPKAEPLAIDFEDDDGADSSRVVAPLMAPPAAPIVGTTDPDEAGPLGDDDRSSPALDDTSGVAAPRGELNRLRERIRELEKELKAKSDEFKAVSREKQKLEGGLDKKGSEHLDRIRTLEKTVEDLEADVKRRTQLVAQMTTSVNQLNQDLEAKESKHAIEIGAARSQLDPLQAELDALKEKSSNQSNENEDKTEEIARLGRQIGDLEGERNELTQNLEAMTAAKNQLDADLATERQRIADGRETLGSSVGALKAMFERELADAHAAIQLTLQQSTGALETAVQQGLAEARSKADERLAEARSIAGRGARAADQTLADTNNRLLGT